MIFRFGRILILTFILALAGCSAESAVANQPLPTAETTGRATLIPTIAATETTAALPTATATQLPTSTADASATPLATATETATALPSATASPTLMPTNTPQPTDTPKNEPTPVPTDVPTATPTEPSALWLMGFDGAGDTGTWYIVNDTVMGGVSTANGYVADGVLMFNGDLSLDNNGGFTSIRREFTTDLTEYSGITMRLRGDGRTYFLRISDNTDGFEVSHEIAFATIANEWTVVTLPFEQFTPNFRGRAIDRPPLDRSALRTMSIMLREKNPGYFQLELDWIQAQK